MTSAAESLFRQLFFMMDKNRKQEMAI